MRVDEVATPQGLAKCSPRHRVPFNSRDSALDDRGEQYPPGRRHVTGCHLTQETRVQSALDDVASSIVQALH